MTLPNITPKQHTILTLLFQFRFLDRTHIQQLLNHKNKQQINRWLKDLTEKNYIHRSYDESIIGKNRIPAIYSLGINGIRFLSSLNVYDKKHLHTRYFEKSRSETFINHCLLIATMCCQLNMKTSKEASYVYATESDYAYAPFKTSFLKEANLAVDLCFSKTITGQKATWFILMLFDLTLPPYRIRKRLRDLHDFYLTNDWENHMQTPFPTLLCIFSTKQQLISFKRYAKTLLEIDSHLAIHFALEAEAKTRGVTSEIWE